MASPSSSKSVDLGPVVGFPLPLPQVEEEPASGPVPKPQLRIGGGQDEVGAHNVEITNRAELVFEIALPRAAGRSS